MAAGACASVCGFDAGFTERNKFLVEVAMTGSNAAALLGVCIKANVCSSFEVTSKEGQRL